MPIPDQVNAGLINVCTAGEQVAVSIPVLPAGTCGFCGIYQWLAPSNSNFLFSIDQQPQSGNQFGSNAGTLYAPNPLPGSGYAGNVYVRARYDKCPNAVSPSVGTYTQLFIGTPTVSNGQINANPYNGGVYYVPGGYATLNVSIDGRGGTNWSVANGSGSLNPSYNYCTVSFNGFVRVVVTANNRCGTGGSYTFYLTTQQGYSGYRVGANPAQNNLSILMDYKGMIGSVIQDVALYDEKGKAWYSANTAELSKKAATVSTIDIITKDFPRGTYFLHVNVGNAVQKQQIVLN